MKSNIEVYNRGRRKHIQAWEGVSRVETLDKLVRNLNALILEGKITKKEAIEKIKKINL